MMSALVRRAGLALGLLLLVVGLEAAAPRFARDDELIDAVVALIEQRLALMPEVAAIKFQQQKPISDPAREREVIEQSVADARALNLDGEAARAFFTVQIAMARAVQEQCFARWQAGGEKPPAARDLVRELRPQLDALGRKLLPAVYLASPALVESSAETWSTRLAGVRRFSGPTDAQLGELASALRALRLTAAGTPETLRRAGVLRVGMTGDYAPFSEERDGQLRGIDVELAQALAQEWGVAVVFVRTSWPRLMEDLTKRRFDLAASGVSITDERRRVADFSAAYFFDGKTPIARRGEAARFSSLDKIDQPGVRVIVNPGGTNERFAREHLKRATLLVHPDNRTIFAEIIAGRADVMITDGVEVRLQEQRHPELRGTMSEPFTRAGKAMLLPRQSGLTARVDAWLKPEVERGRVTELLSGALAADAKTPTTP